MDGANGTACREDVLTCLQTCEPFCVLSEDVLRRQLDDAELLEAPRGCEIYAVADPAESLFIVLEGTVKRTTTTATGKDVALGFYKRGELFNEGLLRHEFDDEERAVAVEKSRLLVVSLRQIEELMRERPEFGLEMTRLLARRMHRLQLRIQNLMYRNPRQRLAALLIELGQDFGRRTGASDEVEVELKITQHEMASLIGVTRESVSYAMGDLQLEEMVRTNKRRIFLTDLRRLSEISG